MGKSKLAILTRTKTDKYNGEQWEYKIDKFEVQVMAISGRYAMVRRKGYYPFICNVKELTFNNSNVSNTTKE